MSSLEVQPNVLVVEDDEDCRDLTCQLIPAAGYRCRGVGTAAEALRAVEESVPDVIFVDIGLPDMDGCELARIINQHPRRAEIFLVAMTGFVGKPVTADAAAAGFDLLLSKPVNREAVLTLLRGLRAGA